MKYNAAPIIALAGLSNALPHPQLGGGGFSLPTGLFGGGGLPSMPTGLLGGGSTPSLPTGIPSLGGSGGGIPSLGGSGGIPSLGSGSGGIPSLGSGSGGIPSLGSGSGGIPSLGSGSGGIPSLGGGSGGLSIPSIGGDLGGGLGSPTTTAEAVAPTATGNATSVAVTATATGSVGADCKPQGAASGGLVGGTENGVKDKNCCTDMTIIFARGTSEMGNVGSVAGPPMIKAIRSKLGNDRVTAQGLEYPASAGGNADLGTAGGKVMAELVKTALSQCPSTKIVLSGYSQGAMVVHKVFANGITASQVSGAVLFGDPLAQMEPKFGGLSADKIKEFCGKADGLCGSTGAGGATGSHLDYGKSAEAAATAAIQIAGLA